MDQLIENVIKICRKSPKERSNTDLKLLMEVTSNSTLFTALRESEGILAHEIACKYLHHEFCDTDSYLFHFGEEATNFYVILSGRVVVEAPVNDQMEEVVEYTVGEVFGELSIENNKPRQASVKCKTPCHFVYLEKSDYKRMLSSILTQKQNKIVSFLQSLPVFSHFTRGTLIKLAYNFSERSYPAKAVVYREDQEPEEFFIIIKGQFTFYKKIVVQNRRMNKKRLGIKKTNQGKILVLGPGEIFGEDEIVNNRLRKYTCMCTDPGVVLVIPRTYFIKRIRGEESLKVMKDRISQRNSAISKRICTWRAISQYSTLLFASRKNQKTPSVKQRRKTVYYFRPPDADTRALKRKLGDSLSQVSSKFVSPVTSEPVTAQSSKTQLIRTKLTCGNRSTKHSPETRDSIGKKLNERSVSITSLNSYPIYCALWKKPTN